MRDEGRRELQIRAPHVVRLDGHRLRTPNDARDSRRARQTNGPIFQLARKPGSHPGNSGFKSPWGHDARLERVPYKSRCLLRVAQRTYYSKNKEEIVRRSKNARIALRDEVNKLKEARGCADCKQPYPYYVLQFDHLDGSTKIGGIRAMIRTASRTKVLAEIEKCEVVCANCHAVRSFKRSLPS